MNDKIHGVTLPKGEKLLKYCRSRNCQCQEYVKCKKDGKRYLTQIKFGETQLISQEHLISVMVVLSLQTKVIYCYIQKAICCVQNVLNVI